MTNIRLPQDRWTLLLGVVREGGRRWGLQVLFPVSVSGGPVGRAGPIEYRGTLSAWPLPSGPLPRASPGSAHADT